ncbi:MAG: leucyl aminopeptidase, partial [Sphingomonas bacterium]|nr:leucyl aminopeptidase [Sphingomonas bacterium]
MKISFADSRPDGDYALVVPVAGKSGSDVVRSLGGGIDAALRRQRFEGEPSAVAEHFVNDRRIVAIGTGDAISPADAAEKLGGAAVARLLISGESHAVIDLTGLGYDADAAARVALAAALRGWRFDVYRTKLKDKQKPTLTAVTIVGAGAGAAVRWTSRYAPLVEGVTLTRELVTEPANIIYPESFVERVKASVEGLGLEIEVLDGAAMDALGMGSLLGVAQGSVRAPAMLIMRWNGGTAGDAPVALLGKGVTFDTGGISIKPAAGMESMKWDMGGAGAVVGAMKALAGRKAKANVVGVCGMVENMPDGNAQRPGDVVTSMSGQT